MFICYYRTMILICTVLFYFSLLLVSGFPVLDFFRAFRCSNVQFTSPASRFGLPTCLPLLQHPICSSGFPVLDFIRVSLCSNVQSMFPASRFWTSSLSHSALTSNSRFRLHSFGLHPCLSPL